MRILYVTTFLILLGLGRLAVAGDDGARAAARSLAQEGARLYEQGAFEPALARFKEAYDKFPSPKLFLNIGLSLRMLSRNVEAVEALERFLTEATEAGPEYRDQAAALAAEMRSKLAWITVDCNRMDAVVLLDGVKRGTIPLSQPLATNPGAHTLVAVAGTEIQAVTLSVEAGQRVRQVIIFEEKKTVPEVVAAPTAPAAQVSLSAQKSAITAAEPQVLLPVQKSEPPAQAPSAHRHTWYWIAGGALVAATATTLILVFTRHDEYPNAGLGTRTLP